MNTKGRPTISIPTCLTEAFRAAALTSENGERIWLEAEEAAGQHVESVFSAGCLTEDAVNLFAPYPEEHSSDHYLFTLTSLHTQRNTSTLYFSGPGFDNSFTLRRRRKSYLSDRYRRNSPRFTGKLTDLHS